jgi:hypothetical protein
MLLFLWLKQDLTMARKCAETWSQLNKSNRFVLSVDWVVVFGCDFVHQRGCDRLFSMYNTITMNRDAQILGARSPWRLKFLRRPLICVGLHYENCHISKVYNFEATAWFFENSCRPGHEWSTGIWENAVMSVILLARIDETVWSVAVQVTVRASDLLGHNPVFFN